LAPLTRQAFHTVIAFAGWRTKEQHHVVNPWGKKLSRARPSRPPAPRHVLQFIARHVLSHPLSGVFVACALRVSPSLP